MLQPPTTSASNFILICSRSPKSERCDLVVSYKPKCRVPAIWLAAMLLFDSAAAVLKIACQAKDVCQICDISSLEKSLEEFRDDSAWFFVESSKNTARN